MRRLLTTAAATLALAGATLAGMAGTASASIPQSAKRCGMTTNYLGLMANRDTGCPFAHAVDRAYADQPSTELRPNIWMPRAAYVRAYSKVTHRSYRMHCHTVFTDDSPYVTCSGGNNARVWIVS